MGLIATGSNKGGVGKSTVTFGLALWLMALEKSPRGIKTISGGNTLIVDLNPNSNLHHKFEGDIPKENIAESNGITWIHPNILDFQADYEASKGKGMIDLENYAVSLSSIDERLKIIGMGKSLEKYDHLTKNKYFLESLQRLSRNNNVIVDNAPGVRSMQDISLKVMGKSDKVILVTEVDTQAQADACRLGDNLLWYNILESMKMKNNRKNIERVLNCTGFKAFNEETYAQIADKALEIDGASRRAAGNQDPKLTKAKENKGDLLWYCKAIREAKERTKVYVVMNKVCKGKYKKYMGKTITEESAADAYYDNLKTYLGEKGVKAIRLATLPLSEEHSQNQVDTSSRVTEYHKMFADKEGLLNDLKGWFGIKPIPKSLEDHFYEMAKNLREK